MATGAGLLVFPNGLRGQGAPGNKLNIALLKREYRAGWTLNG